MKSLVTLFGLSVLVYLLTLEACLLAGNAQNPKLDPVQAQKPQPGQIDTLELPLQDHNQLLGEDLQQLALDTPVRFATAISVTVTPLTHGTWDEPEPGLRRWRLRVLSPPALSLNFGFSRYNMPPGGQLRLYTPDGSQPVRPFTAKDNEAHGQLWTPLLTGEAVIIEVTLPAADTSALELQLSWVNHGYREFSRATPDKSGSCNVDVVCSDADNWRDELRAVAVYSLSGPGGSLVCSGALINNTAQDLTPYFLTANHCNISSANAPSMVVYWNYQNSTCRLPGSDTSGSPGDGSLSQFSSGAILRAVYPNSDMALVELDDPIDPAFNLFWAGWDRSASPPQSAVTIHHPNAEEKRISLENAPLTITSYLGATSPGDGGYLRVADWDLGTTEAGSSGAPLFNPTGQIVGQLRGGYAACNNNNPDWFGRLAMSWDGGGTAASRLKDWLDPLNAEPATLEGVNQTADFMLTASPATLGVCLPDNSIFDVSIGSSMGYTNPVTLNVSGLPVGTAAAFGANPVSPPGNSSLTITNTAGLTGSYGLNITGMSATNLKTNTVTLNLFDVPGPAALISPAYNADSLSLSPLMVWCAATQGITYTLEIATDPSFGSVVYSTTVNAISHVVGSPLLGDTTYYWRVEPRNVCGQGTKSAVYSFSTVAASCRTPHLTIPDNSPAGIADTLTIVGSGATHSFVGDLSFALKHEETGTSITLVNRPYDINRNIYCGGDDLDVVLDDTAESSVDTECTLQIPSIAGSFKPSDPLDAFAGENIGGNWQLTASDNGLLDTGTLVEWCLYPTLTPKNVYLPIILAN